MARKRVAIAISGGVDSSAAALLLKESGYEVIGLHMRLWNDKKDKSGAQHYPSKLKVDFDRAERVCDKLDIPFHAIDLKNEFKTHVIDYFCNEYAQGKTPNPCIACNKYIKFGLLLNRALSLGSDYLATGHYAKVECCEGMYHLLKGKDSAKDQSYMLYALDQAQLSSLVFPLGDYLKKEVRKLARQNCLPAAEEPGSQDICFIDGEYADFLAQNVDVASGEIVDKRGEILGRHKGVAFYTVGQRHGLGFYDGQRMYVIKIEPEKNRIVVGTEEDLYSKELIAKKVNWVSGKPPSNPMDVAVKIRYKSPEVLATLYPDLSSAKVQFHRPQRAITPGQSVVFYQNDEVIGGGIIEKQE